MQDLLFRVIDKGHEYKIYTNGEIEGFGKDAIVFNHFSQFVADARVRQSVQLLASCHPQTAAEGTEHR
jgi:hypothetical protein